MPGGHSELDVLARFLCHQEHSRGHPGNVLSDLVHHPRDPINLLKILTSYDHNGAFVGRLEAKASNIEIDFKMRDKFYFGKSHWFVVTKVENEASLVHQNIGPCLPGQKVLDEVNLIFILYSKTSKNTVKGKPNQN